MRQKYRQEGQTDQETRTNDPQRDKKDKKKSLKHEGKYKKMLKYITFTCLENLKFSYFYNYF